MNPVDLEQWVQVPVLASDVQIGDRVLVEGHTEPWTVYRLHAASWGPAPHVVSPAPNPDWAGPRFERDRLSDPVTLLVAPEDIPTPAPHGARIRSHAPAKRGWYTDPGGWDVACGCGWRLAVPVEGNRAAARREWLRHKASALTGLLAVTPGRPRTAMLARLPEQAERFGSRRWRLVRLNRGGGSR
ncbi:hypothetical protein [Amycolatopsis echigonensis]|uniref:Uncharacterized protein n=1 Tax=Amycolatopsis echigonensis TaxID=2576905 RepID=A0A8E2B3K3_9PSEU|nr:hypothetical protein [Amycolatopsis echigonensis]MBB2501194.1 hypothetical protein [Amycolatopsis echigonensis]